VIALAWALLLAFAWPAQAVAQSPQPVPALSARVTDLTGTLAPAERASLEARLEAIEQRKGAQVAVLVVGSTQPEAIEAFSIRVAEQWKLGRGTVEGRKVDDGVLLLVAKDDRRVRIEVGYGLEGAIPDALARRIIAEAIAPRFRQGDFFGGLEAAVAELARLIDGESLPEPWQAGHEGTDTTAGESAWGGAMIAMVVIGVALTSMFGRWLGSALGGAGAGVITFVNLGALGLAIGASATMFALLLVLSSLLSMPMRPLRGGGRSSTVWTSGRSGGWRSSGGGFGGGGGSFGGGGASGGW
jgi:uncharacterized protein